MKTPPKMAHRHAPLPPSCHPRLPFPGMFVSTIHLEPQNRLLMVCGAANDPNSAVKGRTALFDARPGQNYAIRCAWHSGTGRVRIAQRQLAGSRAMLHSAACHIIDWWHFTLSDLTMA